MARLGERLVAAGKINVTQLKAALRYQARRQCRLGEAIEVLPTLAQQLHVPYIFIGSRAVPERLLRLVPAELMRAHRVLPVRLRVERSGRETVYLATSDPTDQMTLDLVALQIQRGVRGVLGCRRDLEQALARHGIFSSRRLRPVAPSDFDPGDFVVWRDYQPLH